MYKKMLNILYKIHIHIHTYISHTYNIYIYIYVYIHVYICKHAHMHTYVDLYKYVYICAYILGILCAMLCKSTMGWLRLYVHVCINTHTYTYLFICMYTSVQNTHTWHSLRKASRVCCWSIELVDMKIFLRAIATFCFCHIPLKTCTTVCCSELQCVTVCCSV